MYSKKTAMPNYLNGKIEQGSVWHLIKDLELPREWLGELADYSRSHELTFILISNKTNYLEIDLNSLKWII